ncbi:hypothetical protein C8J57DRAFT_1513692 [Mycena rebaudengoi]|nr:hypothetical protein C8J57DRAFT_1513692 [Mycena rebaudengoi]
MSDQAEIAFLRGSQPVNYADDYYALDPTISSHHCADDKEPAPARAVQSRRPANSIARIKEQLAHAYLAAEIGHTDLYGFANVHLVAPLPRSCLPPPPLLARRHQRSVPPTGTFSTTHKASSIHAAARALRINDLLDRKASPYLPRCAAHLSS